MTKRGRPAKALSQRAYAKHRKSLRLDGGSPEAVSQAIKSGRLTKSVKRGPGNEYFIDPKRADIEWAASTYSDRVPLTGPTAPTAVAPIPAGAAGDDVMSLGEARARLEAAKAALAEMDLEERRGDLVQAREVEARLVAVFSSCKVKLLGVPSRVRQQDPGLTKAQVELIEATVREALEDLAGEPELEEATA